MSERQVFISHASRDAELARALVRLLEEQGVTCWISGRDVAFGANYQEAIVGAISGARALVLLLLGLVWVGISVPEERRK